MLCAQVKSQLEISLDSHHPLQTPKTPRNRSLPPIHHRSLLLLLHLLPGALPTHDQDLKGIHPRLETRVLLDEIFISLLQMCNVLRRLAEHRRLISQSAHAPSIRVRHIYVRGTNLVQLMRGRQAL